jgi:hypothetical protein
MSRPCVCGGSNENCRFCGGLGTLPDRLGAALEERLQHLESGLVSVRSSKRARRKLVSHRMPSDTPPPPSAPDARFQTPCPECGVLLRPGRVASHLRKVHAAAAPVHQLRSVQGWRNGTTGNKNDRRYESCSVCNATVGVDRIERHMAKAHKNLRAVVSVVKAYGVAPDMQQKDKAAPLGQPQKVSTEYETCRVCKVRVRASRMNRHMRKAHKRKLVHPPRAVPRSSKDPLRDTTTLVAPRDKNLDATKLYAHSYREQGRYGSHPSHDGFDDDSGPE